MKKLKLKESAIKPEVKKTEAEIIYNNAKEELKKVICKYAGALYTYIHGEMPNFGNGENVCIEVAELCEDIFVETAPAEFKELVEVRRITCFLDNTVMVEDENGNEFDTLSLNELARIADVMEKSYDYRKKGLM